MQTHLWVASNNLFASVRPYQPPLEADSRTGLRPLKKYPQLGWGMLIYNVLKLITLAPENHLQTVLDLVLL